MKGLTMKEKKDINKPYLTLKEVASTLGISYGLVYKNQTKFDCYRVGSKIMIPKKTVENFITNHKI